MDLQKFKRYGIYLGNKRDIAQINSDLEKDSGSRYSPAFIVAAKAMTSAFVAKILLQRKLKEAQFEVTPSGDFLLGWVILDNPEEIIIFRVARRDIEIVHEIVEDL